MHTLPSQATIRAPLRDSSFSAAPRMHAAACVSLFADLSYRLFVPTMTTSDAAELYIIGRVEQRSCTSHIIILRDNFPPDVVGGMSIDRIVKSLT